MVIMTIAAIAVTLYLGFKKNINIGLVGTVFALIIGCFFAGMSPNQVFAYLPVKVLFKVVPITMFYGFALENGTLNKLVDKLLYATSKWAWFFPCATYIICVILGISGIGAGSLSAILAPIIMAIASLANLNVMVCCAAIAYGASVGSSFVTSEGGSIGLGILEKTSMAENALNVGLTAWFHIFVLFTVMFIVYFLIKRGHKHTNKDYVMERPEPFTPLQKKNLRLMGIVVFLLIVPLVLYLITKNEFTTFLYKKLDLGVVMLMGALAACLMKLGDFKRVVRDRIPWNTIIVVSGMTILIGVATEVGLTDAITKLASEHLPKLLIMPVMSLVAALLSCFCSVVSVVLPTLYPLVDTIAAATGVSFTMLASAIFTGACVTGVSPFSTGGSLILSCCTDEKKRDEMTPKMILLSAVGAGVVAVYFMIVQFF